MKIAEGCNHHCLYCIIPKLKGEYRSREPESIIAEVEHLLARGVKEINLVAQDTTAYGADSDGALNLSFLLSRLDQLEGEFWLRFFYTYPSQISDELCGRFGTRSISATIWTSLYSMPVDAVLKKDGAAGVHKGKSGI